MNEKINNKLLAIPITLSFLIITLFCFFCIGLSKVDAASYYFDYPRINTICNNDRLGICTEASGNGISTSDSKIVGNPNGLPVGNYVNVIYRYDQNINGVTGTNFIAGNYSVSLKYQIRLVEGTSVPKNLIKVRLIYYPDNSNQYAYATCDNNENITITNAFEDSDMFNITYTCETLQITEGKSFLGFNIKLNIDDPFGLGSKYIKYGEVITNLTLIGEGEATNNDIINNQNQNTQDIINNATQNTDKVVDAIEKSEETNQGILETITNFFSNFFDGLIGIFVPSNFDFLTGFLDTLENKLGFIASVPIQFLEFLANLVTIDFDTVTSVTLPHFEILGYTFIDEQEIDLSEIMAVFQPYRIYTNIGCVCLCIRYLMKLYENFANKE